MNVEIRVMEQCTIVFDPYTKSWGYRASAHVVYETLTPLIKGACGRGYSKLLVKALTLFKSAAEFVLKVSGAGIMSHTACISCSTGDPAITAAALQLLLR